MPTNQALLDTLRRFASAMAADFEVNDALYELCDGAVDVLDAHGAGVSVVTERERLEFVTATDETVVEMERAQQRHQDGPCIEAFVANDVVAVSDLDDLERWPEYRATAERTGVVSVIGLPLALDSKRIGSLDVYDVRVRRWDDDDLTAVRVLADMATAYLVRAGALAEARRLNEQLEHALESRVIIEQAKGVLSREHGVSVDEAFELLRAHSRSRSVALRELAHGVVHLGMTIPPLAGSS